MKIQMIALFVTYSQNGVLDSGGKQIHDVNPEDNILISPADSPLATEDQSTAFPINEETGAIILF
ncbi:hypothetical protein THO17_21140 [Marinomonas sp. THO17]